VPIVLDLKHDSTGYLNLPKKVHDKYILGMRPAKQPPLPKEEHRDLSWFVDATTSCVAQDTPRWVQRCRKSGLRSSMTVTWAKCCGRSGGGSTTSDVTVVEAKGWDPRPPL
jgi:hypothetical protein